VSIKKLVIYGAGGHASVVLDAYLANPAKIGELEVVDGDAVKSGSTLLGYPVIAPFTLCEIANHLFHVGIGDNRKRENIYSALLKAGGEAQAVAHPRATISLNAVIRSGCFLAAQAIVGPRSELGQGTIVNHGAVVDHDCILGSFCHIAPNASLGGGAKLADGVFVGAGANILPGVKIGAWAVIGAGAVVLRDVESSAVMIGIPAKKKANI
jgi:sugar O-acyltransferase (sialic acid O-acetyltransferase NeuD family)